MVRTIQDGREFDACDPYSKHKFGPRHKGVKVCKTCGFKSRNIHVKLRKAKDEYL